jgi:hypothetical protein
LGAIVAEVFMVILFAIKKSEKRALSIVKHLGLIAIVTLLTFPAVFTTTRIIPAVVNDPILSDIELTGYEVLDPYGRDLDCYRYVYELIANGMKGITEKLLPTDIRKKLVEKPKKERGENRKKGVKYENSSSL